MFELTGGIIEAFTGYILGRFQVKSTTAQQMSIVSVSLLLGLIFFIGYGTHSLLFPSPKAPDNWAYGLAVFSISVSFFAFLIINIDIWWKNRSMKTKE